ESTTLMHLAREGGLVESLRDFARRGAIMGTCAGLIVLARRLLGSSMQTLDLLDILAERNGFGRQVQSFIDHVDLDLDGQPVQVEGVFIRAPRIREVGLGVAVLGRWQNEAVMVRSGRILALTFHPELTADTTIHRYFVQNMVPDSAHNAGAA
ncbi:MAG: pyridoxal 5'-phosphate synthase glutaminase subunit PdxT, partial [Candidatus Aminicenantes bacterium]|nr:pyridoxal 5'-phosphate synthase glutaminase subunit PdxT [Candidatus Aminicenantes bacterium]